MKRVSKFVLTVTLTIGMGISGYSQESESGINASNKTEFSIEVDPLTFGLNGYGIHLRIKPKNSQHLLLGVGAYAMDFPSVLVNLNSNNKDMGWNVRLNQGYGLFGEYHFSEVNKKWFVGAQLAYQEFEIQKEALEGESAFGNVLLMGTGGYTLQPFEFPLYFKFWGGVGYTDQISGENSIGSAQYDIVPVLLFGALHVGYTINKK